MLLRVPIKSVSRQHQQQLPQRGSKIYVHFQRLTIFTIFVIFITAFKHFSFNGHRLAGSTDCRHVRPDRWSRCPQNDRNETTTTTMTNATQTMGGLEMNECLMNRLMTSPRYASELCRNASENCTDLTCLKVLTSPKLDQFDSFLKLIPPNSLLVHERAYPNLTEDCAKYKREAGYVLSPLDEESENYPIAFNILVHNGVSQFELLLKTIYRPQNSFCIHVDNKSSPDFHTAISSIARCFDNVFLASKLESIRWASYNRLQADINCMKDQLLRKTDWKYLINTAAQAFPLRTVEEMVRILKIYNGANDIEGIYGKRVLRGRFENEWIEAEGAIKKSGKKNPKPPHDIDIVRGSAYGIFSRNFVRFIVEDKRAIDLLEWSRRTWSPDEFYWSTLHHTYSNPHLKTPGGFRGYPSDKKWLAVYANWGEYPCHGRIVRGVCVNGVKDIHRLVQRKELFVNKFYADLQPLALSCLHSWIISRQECRAPFDDSFYRSLNFINKTT